MHQLGDHLDILRHLADGGAHAALAHAVRAAEIELDTVGAGVLDQGQDVFPCLLLARHHDGDDDRPVRPVLLDLLDLAQVEMEIPVGDQLDIVQSQKAPVGPEHGTVARTVDIDDRGAFFAERFPDNAAPSRFEGAFHIIGLVGRRGGGQPERIGGFDPNEIIGNVGHVLAPYALRAA